VNDLQNKQDKKAQEVLETTEKLDKILIKQYWNGMDLDKMQEQHDSFEEKRRLADKSHSDAEREYHSFGNQIEQTQARQIELQGEVKEEKDKSEKLRKRGKDLDAKIKKEEDKSEKLRKRGKDLDAEIKKEEDRLEELRKQRENLDTKIEERNLDDEYHKKKEDLGEQISGVKSALETLQKERELKEEENTLAEGSLRKKSENLNDETEVEKLINEKRTLDKYIEDLENASKERLAQLNRDKGHDSRTAKIDIIVALNTPDKTEALSNIEELDSSSNQYQSIIEKLDNRCESNMEEARSTANAYSLRTYLADKTKEKQSEYLAMTVEEITDQESYEAADSRVDGLKEQLHDSRNDCLQLRATDTRRRYQAKAKSLIDACLDDFATSKKMIKLAEELKKYEERRISELRDELGLEEKSDIMQYINTLFENETIENSNFQQKRAQSLKSYRAEQRAINEKIQEKRRIIDQKKREDDIKRKEHLSNMDKINKKIKSLDKDIQKKTNYLEDLKRRLGKLKREQEKLAAKRKEEVKSDATSRKKNQTEEDDTAQKKKEIDDQQSKIDGLKKDKANINTSAQKVRESVNETWKAKRGIDDKAKIVANNISNMEREIEKNNQTIGELHEKQREAGNRQEEAINEREHYNKSIHEVEGKLGPLRQREADLSAQIESRKETFKKLMGEEGEIEREKREFISLSFIYYLQARNRLEEVLGLPKEST